MTLEKLLSKLEYEVVKGTVKREITSLSQDSRRVKEGTAFVCLTGAVRDAHEFIPEVIGRGASAVIIEKDVSEINGLSELLELNDTDQITFIKVKNTREALAFMAAEYFDNPADKLITIGVTGTKGKTTTTYMIKDILERAGIKTGLIGTIEVVIGNEIIHSSNTTPESYAVQNYFKRMVDAGMKAVVMEVSSQGLMMHRIDGFTFDYGIFTNLEPDHIGPNEHASFEEYMYWKSTLFQRCRTGILNRDSEHFNDMLKGHTCAVETFGIKEKADTTATDIIFTQKDGKLETVYVANSDESFKVELNMPGMFSVYNSLTAIALCKHFDVPTEVIRQALLDVNVKGRTEIMKPKKPLPFTVMIDYAHNAMALESLLETIRLYNPKRIVTVFGCGGNRAKSRRFEMGEVSSKLSDLTVVTSDNPRFEEPGEIIKDILVGVQKGPGKYETIPDRREAVKFAIHHAEPGDVIVVAGKGHEDYQEIKGAKYHMDDHELVEEAFSEVLN